VLDGSDENKIYGGLRLWMGGIWAMILASSKGDIVEKYPVLQGFDIPPDWMSTVEYKQNRCHKLF
jgi:hypothetical protein